MKKEEITFEQFKQSVLQDYKVVTESREASLLGRKEVLTGKAKFGIFGDGKEVAQVAMAKTFIHGDFRSGYYRDQTFMLAIGELTIDELFAQLYSNTDVKLEPASAGRQMNNHFATRSLDQDGNWKDLTKQYNSSSDISPTAAQMPRLLGLGYASKIYRNNKNIQSENFSNNGQEIGYGTIGNASTSEGLFFETINAAGVLQIPIIISVWDDRWGISVPSKYQTTKEDISEVLKGFQRTQKKEGLDIIKVNGWDYSKLCSTYIDASKKCREEHIPVIIHVNEMTQPQGHSTSGSHERYKTKEELDWEKDFDCIKKMREWIINQKISTEKELLAIEKTSKDNVKKAQKKAWDEYLQPIVKKQNELSEIVINYNQNDNVINSLYTELIKEKTPNRKLLISTARSIVRHLSFNKQNKDSLLKWLRSEKLEYEKMYTSHLYSESNIIKDKRQIQKVLLSESIVDARVILRDNFDSLLTKYPEIIIFGEDSGKIGDVNQGLEGLQQKHGINRVTDTGIREATIIGQGIGLAMRGLRPIAEIQYLDYLLYAIQILSDDLATLHYRTAGGQKCPLIIRTRGHRLEGIWHSGSPMGGIINLLRGLYILVPRNMTKAAGFYNHLLKIDQPALVIECLNGYRLKEQMPNNLGEYDTEIGEVETIKTGNDITIVTYGSCCRIAIEAAKKLEKMNISIEVIDVQSLIPFDINMDICKSIQKTNKIIFMDEDVPGGGTAYMLQQVIEKQKAFQFLDSPPSTISAVDNRPAYGDDGDYFSKPQVDDIIDKCYNIMSEYNPTTYPDLA